MDDLRNPRSTPSFLPSFLPSLLVFFFVSFSLSFHVTNTQSRLISKISKGKTDCEWEVKKIKLISFTIWELSLSPNLFSLQKKNI